MTLLNEAARIYLGTAMAEAVFAGATQVWPGIGVGFETFDAATAINVALTGGGLVVVNLGAGTNDQGAHTVTGKTGGKHYYEARLSDWATGGSIGIGGVAVLGSPYFDVQNIGNNAIMLQSTGQIWSNAAILGDIGTRASGDNVAFAVDMDNRKWWCRAVSPTLTTWNGNPSATPVDHTTGLAIPPFGVMAPYCTFGGVSTGPGNRVTTNFGSHSMVGAVPPGFNTGWTIT